MDAITEATEIVETPEASQGTSELDTFRASRKAEREGTSEPVTEAAAEPAPEQPPAAGPIPPALHAEIQSVIDKRVDRIGAKAREASEHEILRLRQEVETLRGGKTEPVAPAQPSAPVDPNDPEPTLEQFADKPDPYQAYIAASARWNTRQETQLHETARAQAESQVRVEAQITNAQTIWDDKLPAVRKAHPNFDQAYDAVHQTLLNLPNEGQQKPLVETLLTSPQGHELAYYLGTHPEELTRLFQAPSLKAHLREIGRLEARVESAMTPATSAHPTLGAPPPPMAPVGSSATPTSYDAKTASLSAFRKRHGVKGGRAVRLAG